MNRADECAQVMTPQQAFDFARKFFPGGEAIVTIKRAAKVLIEYQKQACKRASTQPTTNGEGR